MKNFEKLKAYALSQKQAQNLKGGTLPPLPRPKPQPCPCDNA